MIVEVKKKNICMQNEVDIDQNVKNVQGQFSRQIPMMKANTRSS